MVSEKEVIHGITNEEASRRLKRFGLNRLRGEKKISPLKIFISQFNDFIIWVLIGATILSGIMGEKADAITIIVIVIINAIMGFIQEYRTEKSLEALKKITSPTAKVIRDGRVEVINAELIVPGDFIVLESGDRIPADAALIEDSSFMVDESLLTGESVGVFKNSLSKDNYIYMGTVVLTGKAVAKVINTGMKTEMGKIANMLVNIEDEKSPLKEKLTFLGKVLVILCILICIIVTVMGILRGQDKYQMFLLGVSLAVAAIPEGLPAIVTVALALGVSRMLKRNAIVRRLPAVETLGCTSIICSDKTGTLTQNNMTVKEVYFDDREYKVGTDYIPENKMLKKCFVYCNSCNFNFDEKDMKKCMFGDPTETALISFFFNSPRDLENYLLKVKKIYEIPFDSERKMMSVILNDGGSDICFVKGAPEKLIERCSYVLENGKVQPITQQFKLKVIKAVNNMSYNALRCIAGAYKDRRITKSIASESGLTFVGIAGLIDPPRLEVKDAVLKCRTAGIRPVMITGDHKNTAFSIGKEIGICKGVDEVMTGEEIDKLSNRELINKVDNTTIFARVSPNHKLRIVQAFKSRGYVVAMTGDGVNDAPAVKEADIGVSMGISGTDVTKEASSMILLDDNFSTIVAAVEEGRIIYSNIRKFIRYLLSCNLGEVLTMFLSSLFYVDTPLLPIQILLVNLATDGLPALALGVDPPDCDIMLEKPRKKDESIFSGGLVEKIVIRGVLIGVCTILSFLIGMYYKMSLKTCRTLALCTLILSQLIHVFECRSENHSIFEIKLFTNIKLVGAVFISIVLLLSVLYIPFFSKVFHTTPLNIGQWLIVLFFSGIIAFINSVYLYVSRK